MQVRDLSKRYREAILLMLVLFAALYSAGSLVRATSQINLDSNEGWNAYQADKLYKGLPLYPDYEALTANNYPPLSFVIVGAVGMISGDHIFSGRVIGLLSLLVVCIFSGLCVYRICHSRFGGVLAGLVMFILMNKLASDYVGINDPQWLAHAIAICGLYMLMASGNRTTNMIISAFLIVLAGFVKHNLVPLPIAAALWLFLFHRRYALVWVTTATVTLMTLFGLTYGAFGQNMMVGLFDAPRVYSTDLMMNSMGRWLPTLVPSLAVAACLVFVRNQDNIGEKYNWLILLYVILSFIFGAFTLGGVGVDVNGLFDLTIASCIAAGVVIGHYDQQIKHHGGRHWLPVFGVLILVSGLLISAPTAAKKSLYAYRTLNGNAMETAGNIEFIKKHPDPVMCETLSLCYWAGKEISVDFFMTGQKLINGTMSADKLLDNIRQKRYSLIQIDKLNATSRLFPDIINQTIALNYQIVRTSELNGAFLEPR